MGNRLQALRRRIQTARREIPADLVLKRGRVLNVFSGDIHEGDVAICEGSVAGLGPEYHGREEIDVSGKWIAPGLIDGHMHIESSMLLPSRLAEALLPLGTTTIISDPHEIGNVMGIEGIRFMLSQSQSIPFSVFLMAPSCVPATPFETSGAQLDASKLSELKDDPRVLGLGEMMNYPGVLCGAAEVLEKLILFEDKRIDGHAPSLSGYDLQGYLAAGIRSEHETTARPEGLEKVQSGMMLMIREGTSAKNLDELIPLVNDKNARRFCFVSDDLHPQEILERGHLDFMIRRAIGLGLDPVIAVQMATLNPAEYFGLRDRGAIGPGYRADLVVVEDLESFTVDKVLQDGNLVVEASELIPFAHEVGDPIESRPMKIAGLTPESFRIRYQNKRARIIELVPGQIITRARRERVRPENGYVATDPEADILKLAVVERHRATGHIGLGLVRGFGLNRGAFASSVAHDSHNVIAVGVEDRDLYRAVEEVRVMGGGMVVVSGDQVMARTPLPIGGLISTEGLDHLAQGLGGLRRASASLGCRLREPFMALSFLALPVIPELKLTDMGLVDVERSKIVPLFIDDR